MVKSVGNDWSGLMQMGGQVSAITHPPQHLRCAGFSAYNSGEFRRLGLKMEMVRSGL